MANEFTAILERDADRYVAYCPEIPGANGQGKSRDEALDSLSSAIALILEDRREDGLRGLPPDAIRDSRPQRRRGTEPRARNMGSGSGR